MKKLIVGQSGGPTSVINGSLAGVYYEAKKKGFKKIVTGVSSNNIDSVKTHLFLGYSISNIEYIMVKHVGGKVDARKWNSFEVEWNI